MSGGFCLYQLLDEVWRFVDSGMTERYAGCSTSLRPLTLDRSANTVHLRDWEAASLVVLGEQSSTAQHSSCSSPWRSYVCQ
jgi:hypothetical protein